MVEIRDGGSIEMLSHANEVKSLCMGVVLGVICSAD